MKTLPVGELKAHFSEILDSVQHGESIGILYGKKKKPIAMIVPYVEDKPEGKRKLGILEGKAKAVFKDDFAMTAEELLGIDK
jgi:antitoxin (DNA-binding transcriptional repressor) of toxin-antitoxin stability system